MLPLERCLTARRPSYFDEAPRVMFFSPDPSADQRSCADDLVLLAGPPSCR